MSADRVTFVATGDWAFVRRDREDLARTFVVRDVRWKGKRSLPRLAWSILRSDVSFSWFALDHAYAACRIGQLLGRGSVVVVGGGDAARVPELGYGAYLNPAMAARGRYVLAHADRVVVLDDFLRDEIARNAGVRRPEIVTIPLGFDTGFFRPAEVNRESVLTVGYVTDSNVRRKGLDTFVKAAALLRDLPFVLVGAGPSEATDRLRSQAPSNVRFVPPLTPPQLLSEYQRARVYVQASIYEGLPGSLGEAMACGCVPVGSRVAGIPTLIGDTGFLVPPGDVPATVQAIRSAYGATLGGAARRRIEARFAPELRREALRRILRDLIHRGAGRA